MTDHLGAPGADLFIGLIAMCGACALAALHPEALIDRTERRTPSAYFY